MNNASPGFRRFYHSVVPAFLLAISVGQIYAFTNFSSQIAEYVGQTQRAVQFAFSLGIFFLGMGAAFFGKVVEKNIKLSTAVGTALFISGLCVTAIGISSRSLALIYLGYGFMVGTGTGIIYISPVKTMMLWFPNSRALAAALPIISFGLGSTLSTILFKGMQFGSGDGALALRFAGFEHLGIAKVFYAYAAFYTPLMVLASFLIKKPVSEQLSFGKDLPQLGFSYSKLLKEPFFIRSWIFMFLNISSGLCLIPLAKQMMKDPSVGYSEGLITAIIALCGIMNGGGRFLFAWWSDRLRHRINILLFILSISAGVMLMSFQPICIGLALLVINACYGAGFSVIPAILSDQFGMTDISKIHGAVLSAWGFAGLAGNQLAIVVSERLGLGNQGVVAMLVVFYLANLANVAHMRKMARR